MINTQLKFFRTGILFLVATIALIVFLKGKARKREDKIANEYVLSLPISDKKLVIAHCMTNIIRYKGHKFEDSCDPEYYAPAGNITAPLGGLTQVNVLSDKFLKDKTLDEAVEFEIRTAIRFGIDGFQFYYTMGNTRGDEIIKAYLRVATQKNIDFKFTFCISHPSGGSEESRIDEFAGRMNSILDEAGRTNPHWLKTPDGRLIIYTWYGDGLADLPKQLNAQPAPYYVAMAYDKLAEAVHEKFACIISINEQITDEKLNNYLDYFPAVWLWTLPYTDQYIGNRVAAICKERDRTFTGSAFPDFYTSKLIKKGTWDMFHSAADAVKAGMANTERKYIVTGLSYNFRRQLEFAIDKNVQLINIITWNDYPEGHHLAPEVNHNDGFSILLQYFKSKWKKENSPFENEDVMVAFYKKYRHDIKPSPFDYPVTEIEKPGVPLASEDSLEVITILKKKGELFYNKQSNIVYAGLQSTRFAAMAGPQSISLRRNGKEEEKLDCPEWITTKPYRTDKLTFSFSNKTLITLKEIFGDFLTAFSKEYNPNSPGNTIHFYKESK